VSVRIPVTRTSCGVWVSRCRLHRTAKAVSREITYQPKADGSQFLVLLSAGGAPTAVPLTVVTNWQATLKK
jgi:hypothetical protein